MPKHPTADPLRHGFIYPVVCAVIDALARLNLVELFIAVGARLAPDAESTPRYRSVAIDVFVSLKWAFVLWVWATASDSLWVAAIVMYLIATNVFTYFYKHVWKPPFKSDDENLRRRFVSLMQALCHTTICYAYLYAVPFSTGFGFPDGMTHAASGLLFSVSRSVFVDFSPVTAITPAARALGVAQTITTFVFLYVILSSSVPQYKKPRKP